MMTELKKKVEKKEKTRRKPREEDGDVAKYDPVPSDACQYGRVDFWDDRYLFAPEPFEWYHDYSALRGLLDTLIPDKLGRILIAGCGNSTLAAEMFEAGYKNIMNCDVSRVVIDQQQTRHKDISNVPVKLKYSGFAGEIEIPQLYDANDLSGVQWVQCSCVDLSAVFEDGVFDTIIDKALLDAIYCGDNPAAAVGKYVKEMDRVLKADGGLYVCISHGLPEARLERLEDTDPDSDNFLSWRVDVHAVPKKQVDPYFVSQLKDPGDVYYVQKQRHFSLLFEEWRLGLANMITLLPQVYTGLKDPELVEMMLKRKKILKLKALGGKAGMAKRNKSRKGAHHR